MKKIGLSLLGVGAVLLLLGILFFTVLRAVIVPPPIYEERERVLFDNYVLRVPPDSEFTILRYPVYGRHEYREACIDFPHLYYMTARNVTVNLRVAELGGQPFNFYVVEYLALREWSNRRVWEKSGTIFDYYEKRGITSDSAEIGFAAIQIVQTKGLCFIAENPNEEDILVKFSATLTWQEWVNYGQCVKSEQLLAYFIMPPLVIGGIVILVIGLMLFIVSTASPYKTIKRPPPPPPP